jgi:hypothetical protein
MARPFRLCPETTGRRRRTQWASVSRRQERPETSPADVLIERPRCKVRNDTGVYSHRSAEGELSKDKPAPTKTSIVTGGTKKAGKGPEQQGQG